MPVYRPPSLACRPACPVPSLACPVGAPCCTCTGVYTLGRRPMAALLCAACRFNGNSGPERPLIAGTLHRFLRAGTARPKKVGLSEPIIPPQRVFRFKGTSILPRSVSQRNLTLRSIAPLITPRIDASRHRACGPECQKVCQKVLLRASLL